MTYGYRLGVMDAGAESFAGETWATAEAPRLALLGATPNPAVGGRLVVQFVLAAAEPASLQVTDIAGRRLASREVGSMGPGRHEVDLSTDLHSRPGIYVISLTQGAKVMKSRVAVLR
jgi:hypothetical protein